MSMEIGDLVKRQSDQEEALTTVVAKIRPLPRDLQPSAEFVQRTRLQLLELPVREKKEPSRRAA